jgi:hypothetical protein
MILAAAITRETVTIELAEWHDGYADTRHLTISPGTPYEEPMLVHEWIWPYTAGPAVCRVIRGGEVETWAHPMGVLVEAK